MPPGCLSITATSGRLLFLNAGEGTGKLNLDYGLADYTLISDDANRWGMRLGRVKNPNRIL